MEKEEAYIPRTDLGFPDRRKKSRVRINFTDEAEVERWEDGDRSSDVEPAVIARTRR